MKKTTLRRKLQAATGFLKIAGVLLAAPFWLLAWSIRAAAARRRFLRELRAAGVPEDAAWDLSRRYKVRLRDLKALAPITQAASTH